MDVLPVLRKQTLFHDAEEINAKAQELTQAAMKMGEQIYKQEQEAGAAAGGAAATLAPSLWLRGVRWLTRRALSKLRRRRRLRGHGRHGRGMQGLSVYGPGRVPRVLRGRRVRHRRHPETDGRARLASTV